MLFKEISKSGSIRGLHFGERLLFSFLRENIFLTGTVSLFKRYYQSSNQKSLIAIKLSSTILLTITTVFLGVVLMPWIFNAMFAALMAYQFIPFIVNAGLFVLAGIAVSTLMSVRQYLVQSIGVEWQAFITQSLLQKYFHAERNYLDLSRLSNSIDHSAQRIQESVKVFITTITDIYSETLRSILMLAASSITLCLIGGNLAFTVVGFPIVIPGYLMIAAFASAAAIVFGARALGKPLLKINKREQAYDGELRKNIELVNIEAENIALEGSEYYHEQQLNRNIGNIVFNAFKKVYISAKLHAFRMFALFINLILPYLISSPAYFMKLITLSQVSQVGMIFGRLADALNKLVDQLENFKKCETSLIRIMELENELTQSETPANEKLIKHAFSDKNEISVTNLNLGYPSESTSYILNNLTLSFPENSRTLIKAPSGTGKSTIFKAIKGSWLYGNGTVTYPKDKKVYCLPQNPFIPNGPLKEALAYPEPVETYLDIDYQKVLNMVDLPEFIDKLDTSAEWTKQLSGGQKQRLAFARTILKHPDYLLLDEATSALDEESESALYQLLIDELPGTTIVSIAHRSSVEQYHSNIMRI